MANQPHIDWIITKRQLGFALAILGLLGFTGILVVDLVRQHGAIGPTQALTLLGCAVTVVVGLTLVPLGNRPA